MRSLLFRGALVIAVFCAAGFAQSLTIVTASLPHGSVGATYAVGLTVSGGIPPYTWTLSGTLPAGLFLNPQGSITGTPTTAGTSSFTLGVRDAQFNSGSRSLSLTIDAQSFTISTATTLPAATAGQPYSQTLTAAGGNPPYQWRVNGLPAGLTLNASTGVISGTPIATGTSTLQVTVTDASQATASGSFSLTVSATSQQPLTITTQSPLFNGTVGVAYSQTFSASGGRTPYTWSATPANPAGLTLDPASGVLSGTPQNTGTFPFTVQVRETGGSTASANYSILVVAPALSLTASSTSLSPGKVGVSYSQKLPVTVSGGTPPYTWSLTGLSDPGLTFDAVNVAISGTPTRAGTLNLTIQVNDSAGANASKTLSLSISSGGLALTSANLLPDATFNMPYSQQMTASGGTPPYTWSANGLPTGLSINSSSGLITGTPVQAGPISFAVTVRDASLSSAADRFTINVVLPSLPNVTLSGLPATISDVQQFPLTIQLDAPFPVDLAGQAILTFAPDSGPGDKTVVFSSGGTTANFTIPQGSTAPNVPISIQTGTVSGTITISLRFQAGVSDVTPSPAPAIAGQVQRTAPVIKNVTVTRGSGNLSVAITGYSPAREITQASFNFRAASGQTLQSSAQSVSVPVEILFANWYQDANNSAYGSQFVFTQPFTIQGDPNAVIPVSVTLTNRIGSTTYQIP